jgi:hypothetical protein
MYNERLDEPILTSQVFNLWSDYSEKFNDIKIEILVFQNIIHFIKNYNAGLYLKNKYNSDTIQIRIYPFALPTRGFLLNTFFIFLHKYFFKLTSFKIKSKIVISRGYVGSYLLTTKRNIKLISDLRSLFVRENVGVRWEQDSLKFKFWMNIEKRIIQDSSSIIAVNNSMSEYFNLMYPDYSYKIKVIPIYTKVEKNLNVNHEKNSELNKINLFYVGSLGKSKWNDFEVYNDFFKSLSYFEDKNIFKITLVLKDSNDLTQQLSKNMKTYNLDYKIHIGLPHKEVMAIMRHADIGIILARPFADAAGRTGIKCIEYLSNNLILLASSCLSDVKNEIENNDIGFVINDVKITKDQIQQIVDKYKSKQLSLKANVLNLYQTKYSSQKILLQYSNAIII